MLQPRFFPPMTLEAYQVYMNFWYAKAQTQTQTGQAQYLMPPTITFAHPTTPQQGVKLSKLVKEVRQLGCETFSGLVDAVMTKNWLKRVFDTLTNMELDDNLKLRMVTRLIDKSVTTWLDNLKLHTITLVTWDVFVQEFNEHFYT